MAAALQSCKPGGGAKADVETGPVRTLAAFEIGDLGFRIRRLPLVTLRSRAAGLGTRSCRCQCTRSRSEEHTSELQSRPHLVCRLLLEKKKQPRPRLLPPNNKKKVEAT